MISNHKKSNLFDNNILYKMQKYYSRFGIGGSLLRIIKKISVKLVKPIVQYNEIVLIEKPLNPNDSKNEIAPNIEVEINLLKKEDFEVLKKVSQNMEENFIENRIKNGESCYVAKYLGQICFYSWISIGERTIHSDSKEIPIGKNEVYIRDCKTVPDFRGNNIAPYFYNYISNMFSAKGFKRAIAYIVSDNYPSIRSFEKAGFAIYEKVKFIKPFFKNDSICLSSKVN